MHCPSLTHGISDVPTSALPEAVLLARAGWLDSHPLPPGAKRTSGLSSSHSPSMLWGISVVLPALALFAVHSGQALRMV